MGYGGGGVEWFDHATSLTPGGWAVEYDYLYILMSLLNIEKPETILEFGIGETSKIIMQYAEKNECVYEAVEEDEKWVEFFSRKFRLSDKMQINILPTEERYITEQGVSVNVYSGLKDKLKGKRYNVISIDGPKGSEFYSRIDILELLPECLEDKFCIMIDDINRCGEKRTVRKILECLDDNKIEYLHFVMGDTQKFSVICSKEYSFLSTIYPC